MFINKALNCFLIDRSFCFLFRESMKIAVERSKQIAIIFIYQSPSIWYDHTMGNVITPISMAINVFTFSIPHYGLIARVGYGLWQCRRCVKQARICLCQVPRSGFDPNSARTLTRIRAFQKATCPNGAPSVYVYHLLLTTLCHHIYV